MIARIRIDPADWARSEGVLVDRHRDGRWANVALYALRDREIDVEVESGDRLRLAGFRTGDVPHGAPAGITALIVGEYVEVPVG